MSDDLEFEVFIGNDDDGDEFVGLRWSYELEDREASAAITIKTMLGDTAHEDVLLRVMELSEMLSTQNFETQATPAFYTMLANYKRKYARQVRKGKIRGITKTIKVIGGEVSSDPWASED